MHWISLLLLGLTAGLFLYIMVLETFLTDSQLTARTFKMSVDDLRKPALNTVMKNLGVYNGLVGARFALCSPFFSRRARSGGGVLRFWPCRCDLRGYFFSI